MRCRAFPSGLLLTRSRKGLKTFDNASGQRHGAIAAQRENVAAGSSRAMDALEKLIDELRKLYEIRDQCLAELQEALEAIGPSAVSLWLTVWGLRARRHGGPGRSRAWR